jgi:hypothetical protein
MRLFSLRGLPEAASLALRHAISRFPETCFWMAAGTALAVLTVEAAEPLQFRIVPLLMVCGLGLPISLAANLASEQAADRTLGLAIRSLGLVVPVLYLLTLPFPFASDTPHLFNIRFFVLAAAAHLAVAVAPFLVSPEKDGFWEFNKRLFLRLAAGAFYSAVIFLGVAAALASVSALFDVTISGATYARLWILVVGLFNTLFFLGGVPEDAPSLHRETSFPRPLHILTHFILIPLTIVYFLILYAYIGRIILEWTWPQGWVSALIIGFSTFGVLTVLLTFPLQSEEKQPWLYRFALGLFGALIPLAIVLALAIRVRVLEYGLTEPRYIGLALAVWLAVVAVVMVGTRGRGIRFIPASLGILLLLVSFGPWSMFSLSRASQTDRLERVLEQVLANKHGADPVTVSFERYLDIENTTNYLVTTHGERYVPAIVPDPPPEGPVYDRTRQRLASLVVAAMEETDRMHASIEMDRSSHVEVGDYRDVRFFSVNNMSGEENVSWDVGGLSITIDSPAGAIVLRGGGDQYPVPVRHLLAQGAGSNRQTLIDPRELTFDLRLGGADYRLVILSARGELQPNELVGAAIEGMIFSR